MYNEEYYEKTGIPMTNITREAVERILGQMERREARYIERGYPLAAKEVREDADALRDLLARVEELKDQTHDLCKTAYEQGRLQGLDEAAIELRNKYEYQAARYVEALTEESQT